MNFRPSTGSPPPPQPKTVAPNRMSSTSLYSKVLNVPPLRQLQPFGGIAPNRCVGPRGTNEGQTGAFSGRGCDPFSHRIWSLAIGELVPDRKHGAGAGVRPLAVTNLGIH